MQTGPAKPEHTIPAMDAFCRSYSVCGNVSQAAREAGINRDTVLAWDADDRFGFSGKYKNAKETFADSLVERLVYGLDHPDSPEMKAKAWPLLLMFSLKAHREIYKDSNHVLQQETAESASQLIKLLRRKRDTPATTSNAIEQANAIIQGES